MDGLSLIIGKAPSELSEGELVAKVYEEMERIQEGLKQPLQQKGRKASEKSVKKKKVDTALGILKAAGLSPQEYLDMVKEGEDGRAGKE